MIDEILDDAGDRMSKSIDALHTAFNRIRTGRANTSLLDGVEVMYYGASTPLKQVASLSVEEGRTLVISPWEKTLIPDIEKSIMRSDLGIMPSSSSDAVRLQMPPLTEENRRNLIRQARAESEQARVAIRNIRREAIHDIREMVKEKMISEDDGRRGEHDAQTLTDKNVANIAEVLEQKEADLLEF